MYSLPNPALAPLFSVPGGRAWRYLVTVLMQELGGGHRHLVLSVAPRQSRQLNSIAAAQTSETPPRIGRRVDGEGRCLIRMVGQWAEPHPPLAHGPKAAWPTQEVGQVYSRHLRVGLVYDAEAAYAPVLASYEGGWAAVYYC